ncbi:MAG: L,D-transpeptidase family protein [Synechococcales bacterium]|nr:L,D-transpeptidase family protein [Synechococcales bacterium]
MSLLGLIVGVISVVVEVKGVVMGLLAQGLRAQGLRAQGLRAQQFFLKLSSPLLFSGSIAIGLMPFPTLAQSSLDLLPTPRPPAIAPQASPTQIQPPVLPDRLPPAFSSGFPSGLTPMPGNIIELALPATTPQPADPGLPQPPTPAEPPTPAQPADPTHPTVIPDVSPMEVQPGNVQPVEEPIRLVIQRSKRRVTVYRGEQTLASYPIAVGKPGWETPVGSFEVINMEENPTFKSFKTGRIIKPGPDNPLGVRWIGIWTDGKTQLGFHGTNEPELIGKAVSHGCIRMHNKDVIALYNYVKLGTSVTIKP